MFYRILAALIAMSLIYVAYEVITTHRTYKAILTPSAPFMAMNNETGTIPIVQFIDFRCDVCKQNALVAMDYAEKNPDVLYILRPVYQGGPDQYDEVRTAIATGLQDRYWQTMHTLALDEGIPDYDFYKDNAGLIDIDLKRLEDDALSAEAERITAKNARAANLAKFKSTQSIMAGRKIYYLQKPLTEADLSRIVEAERQGR